MQHVVPNNVARCYVEMLRAFGEALRRKNSFLIARAQNKYKKTVVISGQSKMQTTSKWKMKPSVKCRLRRHPTLGLTTVPGS